MNNNININKAISLIKKELKDLYPEREIESFIHIIFENMFNLSRIDLHLNNNTKITHSKLLQINDVILQLKKNKPIQYIFEESHFFGLKFKVTPNVLIPRQETEELIQWILDSNENDHSSIIDIGTGSGCIAITLSKIIPGSILDAIDISDKALKIAKYNNQKNSSKVNFFQADILNISQFTNKCYDIIVSNPPYVKEKEKKKMEKNVIDYEPHLALFVKDNDALIFYNAIINFAIDHLNKKGCLYFEINEKHALEIKSLLIKKGFFNIEIRKDINNKDRMLRAQLKSN